MKNQIKYSNILHGETLFDSEKKALKQNRYSQKLELFCFKL